MRTTALILLLLFAGCSSSSPPPAATSVEITFAGVGQNGIFDPSLATDPATGRIWMTYSEVSDSVLWPTQNTRIETRLAFSDDAGASWTDTGTVINPAEDITLPQPAPNNAGTWTNEVSALVHDPGAPASERWKLLWHRYLQINGNRAFQHGWIGLRTAAAPTGPWSAERKLFVGLLYDPVNDVTIGPPEVQLDQLDAELNAVLVFTEPGMVATAGSLFVALLAGEGTSQNGRIILLELPHASPTWRYRGSFLVNAQDGPALGFHGFSAPALYVQGSTHYLLATPQTNDMYQGTFVFEIADLQTATLVRAGSVPTTILEVPPSTPGVFSGAAGYVSEATASGIIISEAVLTPPVFFRIFASRLIP